MLNMRPTNDNENGLLYLLTERKLNKLGYHVGQAPANGPIPSLITDVIHKTPAPKRTHLSATSALGLVTRAMKKGKAIPPRLLDALAEAFAADERWPRLLGQFGGRTKLVAVHDHAARAVAGTVSRARPGDGAGAAR